MHPRENYAISFIVNFLCNLAVIFCAETTSGGAVHVIDGDGFKQDGQIVRLWGIDAPELPQECVDRSGGPYPCGRAAKRALSEIFGDSVPICTKIDQDRYGRNVSRCTVNGDDVGRLMVRSGWALDYMRYSGGVYSKEQDAAQDNRTGLWSGSFDMPWDWRSLSR